MLEPWTTASMTAIAYAATAGPQSSTPRTPFACASMLKTMNCLEAALGCCDGRRSVAIVWRCSGPHERCRGAGWLAVVHRHVRMLPKRVQEVLVLAVVVGMRGSWSWIGPWEGKGKE